MKPKFPTGTTTELGRFVPASIFDRILRKQLPLEY